MHVEYNKQFALWSCGGLEARSLVLRQTYKPNNIVTSPLYFLWSTFLGFILSHSRKAWDLFLMGPLMDSCLKNLTFIQKLAGNFDHVEALKRGFFGKTSKHS
jgi:hypothetical protein